jgi:hypothetical protein
MLLRFIAAHSLQALLEGGRCTQHIASCRT